MDEKWFLSVVVRRQNKFVPFLGMANKVSYSVQHKSHIHKEMYICSTGYLPHNNDITSGGEAFKISMERVGKMVEAKKDSYKRVYNDDNTAFTYPKVPQNIIRHKGQLYFQALEVNALSEGTKKNQKYSLMKFFEEKEIPKLEEVVEELKKNTLNKLW